MIETEWKESQVACFYICADENGIVDVRKASDELGWALRKVHAIGNYLVLKGEAERIRREETNGIRTVAYFLKNFVNLLTLPSKCVIV